VADKSYKRKCAIYQRIVLNTFTSQHLQRRWLWDCHQKHRSLQGGREQTTVTEVSNQHSSSNNVNSNNRGSNKSGGQNMSQYKGRSNISTQLKVPFKCNTEGMKGHVFQCHNETQNRQQY
jgi:hypothetical protein